MIATEQKTSKKTRIAVIAIGCLMVLSSGALLVSMVLGSSNQEKIGELLTTEQTAKEERLNQLLEEYGDQLTAAADETNELYFAQFAKYRANVKSYVAANVAALRIKDLVVGKGEELADIGDDSSLLYLGWLGDETVFDSSFEIEDANDPNAWKTATRVRFPTSLTADFITGFKEGLVGRVDGLASGARICEDGRAEADDTPCEKAISGIKVGGIREITIPYQKAYGESAYGSIPAMAPLKFLVMRVPFVAEPEPSDELFNLYGEVYGS